MGFLIGEARWSTVAVVPLLLLGLTGLASAPACYNTGDGTPPPADQFYFPVGLSVSHGGTVLYAVNSDFDLQYNAGTIQSFDLRLMRQHVLLAIANPADPALPLVHPASGSCPSDPALTAVGTTSRLPLGETCAPPVDPRAYIRDSTLIGAFATTMLLSRLPGDMTVQATKTTADDPALRIGNSSNDRLFMPVRGSATLTWASVTRDGFDSVPSATDTKDTYAPFQIRCGQAATGRCDRFHAVGEDTGEEGNTRGITMPGEPFAAAQSEDGTSIVITHQTNNYATLFSTGLSRDRNDSADDRPYPAIKFVAPNLPIGGSGISVIPHDLDATLGQPVRRPSYIETSRALATLSLLSQYADEQGGTDPNIARPFLDIEGSFGLTATASGIDSRDIKIDTTPRLGCKARVAPVNTATGRTQAVRDAEIQACARKPARVFIANRSPAALLYGTVGATTGLDGNYDQDAVSIAGSVPIADGPSKLYLAPVVEKDGAYALRVFVVCSDSSTIYVFDPAGALPVLENVIHVGSAPFAMAFDPFSLDDVARHVQVPVDTRDGNIRRFRFAYVASFTQSFVQILDLDNAVPNTSTYEHVVYRLGTPTNPKGT